MESELANEYHTICVRYGTSQKTIHLYFSYKLWYNFLGTTQERSNHMSEHITRLHDVDSLQADVLNALAKSIDKCRTELSQLNVQEERTYRYAIIRSYSNVLLTSCEVYTLLKEGYPEGALSLSRSLYEAMVIINKLLKGASSNGAANVNFTLIIGRQLQLRIVHIAPHVSLGISHAKNSANRAVPFKLHSNGAFAVFQHISHNRGSSQRSP